MTMDNFTINGRWIDFFLGVLLLALVPFWLAAYGGHVAADTITDHNRRRSVKLKFWGVDFIGLAIAVVYQYRVTRTDEFRQKSGEEFQDRVSSKLDEIIKHPFSQDQQQAAVQLKHELSNTRPVKTAAPEANLQLDSGSLWPVKFTKDRWIRDESLETSDYIGHVIPVTNNAKPGSVVARAEKIKAQTNFSFANVELFHTSLASWQDEPTNAVDIPVGETRYLLVAAAATKKGIVTGFWQKVTIATSQGRTAIELQEFPLPQIGEQPNLKRTLVISLVSESGKFLRRQYFDWFNVPRESQSVLFTLKR
jgi:hypothetical protein